MDCKRKRIALFVGQADEEYQSKFITGFIREAFSFDMDVCVFSMYHKYQNTAGREKGEANIFSLFAPECFDAAVLLEDTIQTAGEADRLEETLHDTFSKPVFIIEKDSRYFRSLFTDCRAGLIKLVDHLIEDHGFKDIAYLSGKKWHKHSLARMEAIKAALEAHGLTLPEERIIYGDFWYKSGELCADTLIEGGKLPDAVVCANDAMAIGLCQAFEERGVKVPEEVAVVSYDSTEEGRRSPKPISSCLIPAEELGGYTAGLINNTFAGRETAPFSVDSSVILGETCGCAPKADDHRKYLRSGWGTAISEEGFESVNNTMAEDLLAQGTILDFLGMLYSYVFQIKGVKSFHLCLNDWWREDKSLDISRGSSGYPDNMIYALRYNSTRLDGIADLEQSFSVKELLPGFNDKRDEPRALFFTPVFNEEDSFGYAAVEYDKPCSYDETYRKWIVLAGRCLDCLRRNIALRYAEDQLDKLQSSKFAALNAAFEKMSDEERADFEEVGHILDENLFTYLFQPIVNTVDGGIYSYEALMRTDASRMVAPISLIRYADMQSRLQEVERATFLNVLKIIASEKDSLGDARIFINSIPGVKLSKEDLRTVERYLDKLADTVVIELTEEAQLNDQDLESVKDLYRRHNVKIAVDDYGTGYSNITNLLRYMPNYVKIDRELLTEIQNAPQKQHFVKEIINFCHDNGIIALAEGIETSEELRTVIHLGADLIQGYYTGKPSATFVPQIDDDIRREIMTYHRELVSGNIDQLYIAGKTNRVSVPALFRNNCSEIIIGRGAMIYKDITLFGAPGVKTNVHIRIDPDYNGRLTLENVYLSNKREHPCIEIGENADVTLVISGENTLHNSGIIVPKTSKLTLEGDGNIRLELYSSDFCGIGNLPDAEAGELVFMQSGTVDIVSNGSEGVCIGGGRGGRVAVRRGRYIIEANANRCAVIGSLSGAAELDISNCNIIAEFNAEQGCGIGSVNGSPAVRIKKCSLKVRGDGTNIVGIGTVNGESLELCSEDAALYFTMSGIHSTAIGALNGALRLETDSTLIKIEAYGESAYAIGGSIEDQDITFLRSDIRWEVSNSTGRDCLAEPQAFRLVKSRSRFIVNGVEVRHESIPEDNPGRTV